MRSKEQRNGKVINRNENVANVLPTNNNANANMQIHRRKKILCRNQQFIWFAIRTVVVDVFAIISSHSGSCCCCFCRGCISPRVRSIMQTFRQPPNNCVGPQSTFESSLYPTARGPFSHSVHLNCRIDLITLCFAFIRPPTRRQSLEFTRHRHCCLATTFDSVRTAKVKVCLFGRPA